MSAVQWVFNPFTGTFDAVPVVDGFPPLVITEDGTYTVRDNTQVPYAVTIVNDGELVFEGTGVLVQVA